MLNDPDLHQAAKTGGARAVRAVKQARQAQQPLAPPQPHPEEQPKGKAYSPKLAEFIIKHLKSISNVITLERNRAKTQMVITPQDMEVLKPLLVQLTTLIEDQEHVYASERNDRTIPETTRANLH